MLLSSLEAVGGLLTNAEVVKVLKDKGAHHRGPTSKSKPSEREVYAALTSRPGPRAAASRTPQQLKEFINAAKALGVTQAEALQMVNLVPSRLLDVYPILEEYEERFDEDSTQALLDLVASHLLGQQPGAEEEQEEDGAGQ